MHERGSVRRRQKPVDPMPGLAVVPGEVGDGSPAAIQKFGAKALGLITGFQTFLAGNEKIEVCDDNPFGAPMSIRATLTPPLSQMAAALQSALAPK